MANEWRGGGFPRAFRMVMTDEQMETLRRQIAAYAAICELLVETHRTICARNSRVGRWGNPYADSRNTLSKPRWSPSPKQFQILERMFNEGVCNPGKLKVAEITAELLQHGQVTETNVFNWFQNRRARSKKKQKPTIVNNSIAEPEVENKEEPSNDEKKIQQPTMVNDSNAEPEVENKEEPSNDEKKGQQPTMVNDSNAEAEVVNKEELSNDEKKKTQDIQTTDLSSSRAEENVSFQKSVASCGLLYPLDPSSGKPENEFFLEPGFESFEHMDFYGSEMQLSQGMDDLFGSMDFGGKFDSFLQQDDDFNTTG